MRDWSSRTPKEVFVRIHALVFPLVSMLCCSGADYFSIDLRGVTLRAGMSEDEVRKALAHKNILTTCGNDNRVLCVRAKDESAGDPDADMLMFNEKKLFSVSKRIGEAHDDDAALLISKVYSFVSEAHANGEQVLVIPGGNADNERARMQCVDMIVKLRGYSLCSFQAFGHAGSGRIALVERYSLGNIVR